MKIKNKEKEGAERRQTGKKLRKWVSVLTLLLVYSSIYGKGQSLIPNFKVSYPIMGGWPIRGHISANKNPNTRIRLPIFEVLASGVP